MGRPKREPLVCECGYTTGRHPITRPYYNLQIHQSKAKTAEKQEEVASQEAEKGASGAH